MSTSIAALSMPPLDNFPEVDLLLSRLGLGTLARQHDITSRPGRNFNWSGVTDTGRQVFVKKLDGPVDQSGVRIRQCLAFDQLLSSSGPSVLASPRCLGTDIETQLLVFELVPDARSIAELARDDTIDAGLADAIGRCVGALHFLPVDGLQQAEGRTALLPSAELLDGLPLPLFEASSAAELQAWGLMQRDPQLVDALRRLIRQTREAQPVAAHCDLRLDQFLLHGEQLFLTDLEEFQAADPARDIGGIVGDLLHRAILAAATAEEHPAQETTTRSRMMQQLAEHITAARPLVAAFWSGYRSQCPQGDSGLSERAAAFAGWHLLDRLLAGARRTPRLGAVARAAAGIGRTALLTPAAFTSTLGLTEAT